jgi:hypothetical protein
LGVTTTYDVGKPVDLRGEGVRIECIGWGFLVRDPVSS